MSCFLVRHVNKISGPFSITDEFVIKDAFNAEFKRGIRDDSGFRS